jgi:hypothetical protein
MSDVPVPAAAPPKPYRLERVKGGKRPELGALFAATMGDFVDNIAGYAMAGIGQMLVVMPVVFLTVFVMYFGLFGVMFVGMIGSGIAGAIVSDSAGDDAGALVSLVGNLVTFAITFAVVFAIIGFISALLAPITASLYREVAAHQRGEGKLELQSAFRQASTDLPRVIMAVLLVTLATSVGFMFCYIPGFIVSFAAVFAVSLAVLHRQGPMASLRISASQAMAAPAWHIPFWLVVLLAGMVAGNIPVLGPMFLVALHVRAHRELFGDGDEPVLEMAS